MGAPERLTKHQRYQLLLTAVATIGGIVTVLIGISSYNYEQEQMRAARVEELKARVWEERLQTYSRVARDVATIAVTCDAESELEPTQIAAFQEASHRFKQGYWGDMSLIEDKPVEIGMIIFGKALDACEQPTDETAPSFEGRDMRSLSYYLAHVYRKSLSRTWNPEHAFDEEVLIDQPLQKMYQAALDAGLDVEQYQDSVARYDK